MRFATVSEVPTPWLCLQDDLRQIGVDPMRLDRIADRSMAENLAALRDGTIEAAQLFEPVVEEALASAAGHLWHAASSRGRTTYTAFITTRDRITAESEPLLRMVRAMFRTEQWMHAQTAGEIAAAIGSFFPTLDRAVLGRALARYQAQQVWGRDPVLPEGGFDRLRRGLVSSGFIGQPTPYAACVDNTLAEKVIAENLS
jgi:NitT/TauT family transport system substrate-binding protein